MIPKECKRLIEVDFPIGVVSAHAAREKSIRHGHPSTLHLWWARRPLAACRAVLMGLLLPDPCDEYCPGEFKSKAIELLTSVYREPAPSDDALRKLLLKFIGEFANWDLSTNELYLNIARELIRAAHPEESPLVVDPFAGGGSIPLEALRLGCEAFASDLNPVACFIQKVLLEDIPRYGAELAGQLREVGAKIKKEAEKELGRFYPKRPILPEELTNRPLLLIELNGDGVGFVIVSDAAKHIERDQKAYTHYLPITKGEMHSPLAMTLGTKFAAMSKKRYLDALKNLGAKSLPLLWETPIAYLWARTVQCESANNCGAEIPLVRSFWLSKKANRKRALRYRVERPKGKPPQIEFEIFEPKSDREVPAGTVTRAKARCLACGAVLQPERVRAQLAARRGGADVVFDEKGRRKGGARLITVVTLKGGEQGRRYRLADERDYEAVLNAQRELARDTEKPLAGGLSAVPDEPLPAIGTLGFRVQRYGMLQWGDLFTARQKLAFVVLVNRVNRLPSTTDLEEITKRFAGFAVSRFSDISNALCVWETTKTQIRNLYSRQAIPMHWDFAEPDLFGDNAGDYQITLETMVRVVERLIGQTKVGQVDQADAYSSPLPDATCTVWFTDPPYYDAVPYSDLSDFFYVWLKRALPNHPLLSNSIESENPLTPKTFEIVQDGTKSFDGLPKDRKFFESRIAKAFAEGRRVLRDDGVGCVVFAHKTTEGWEALLSGMLKAGWTITASWPIATEMGTRLRARESAALATSVHLVCRPRPHDADVGDWPEVKAEMESRVRQWMAGLVDEGIRGADAIFSCIGPAMEVYSRYEKVETPAGREVPLGGSPDAIEPHERGFLAYVFETLSREALRQVLGDAQTEGFEEDARLTALFLWTLLASRTNGNQKQAVEIEPTDDVEEAGEDDEESKPTKSKGGLTLPFDTFIRITRPMGIHYEDWLDRIIAIEKGVVRLMPVQERDEMLFGKKTYEGTEWITEEKDQLSLPGFDEVKAAPSAMRYEQTKGGRRLEEFTTLDRVHRAMMLFAAGQTTLLKNILEEERRRGRRFEQLAFALMPLYGEKTNERRWLDGVQSMMKR